jgi:hypothetical protein
VRAGPGRSTNQTSTYFLHILVETRGASRKYLASTIIIGIAYENYIKIVRICHLFRYWKRNVTDAIVSTAQIARARYVLKWKTL